MSLFNEEAGHAELVARGVPESLVSQLGLLGISAISNLCSAIKTAKYYDMDGRDVIFFPMTDAMDLYASRLTEEREAHGVYTRERALRDSVRWLDAIETDHLRELGYKDRRALHNFKYFTWVEQQGRTSDDLRKLWDPDFWTQTFAEAAEWDHAINDFNSLIGSA
jgi:hypothetical protein